MLRKFLIKKVFFNKKRKRLKKQQEEMQRRRGKTRSPCKNDQRARNLGFFYAVAAFSFVTFLWACKEK